MAGCKCVVGFDIYMRWELTGLFSSSLRIQNVCTNIQVVVNADAHSANVHDHFATCVGCAPDMSLEPSRAAAPDHWRQTKRASD